MVDGQGYTEVRSKPVVSHNIKDTTCIYTLIAGLFTVHRAPP